MLSAVVCYGDSWRPSKLRKRKRFRRCLHCRCRQKACDRFVNSNFHKKAQEAPKGRKGRVLARVSATLCGYAFQHKMCAFDRPYLQSICLLPPRTRRRARPFLHWCTGLTTETWSDRRSRPSSCASTNCAWPNDRNEPCWRPT